MRALYLRVTGRVQGVYFRANTEQKARALGIAGTVRNTSDGAVEILIQGEEGPLDEMLKWCHKGPTFARVDQVEIKEVALSDILGFNILD